MREQAKMSGDPNEARMASKCPQGGSKQHPGHCAGLVGSLPA
jgi:hypothetical protein